MPRLCWPSREAGRGAPGLSLDSPALPAKADLICLSGLEHGPDVEGPMANPPTQRPAVPGSLPPGHRWLSQAPTPAANPVTRCGQESEQPSARAHEKCHEETASPGRLWRMLLLEECCLRPYAGLRWKGGLASEAAPAPW